MKIVQLSYATPRPSRPIKRSPYAGSSACKMNATWLFGESNLGHEWQEETNTIWQFKGSQTLDTRRRRRLRPCLEWL